MRIKNSTHPARKNPATSCAARVFLYLLKIELLLSQRFLQLPNRLHPLPNSLSCEQGTAKQTDPVKFLIISEIGIVSSSFDIVFSLQGMGSRRPPLAGITR
jgi:hypothetical protein